MVQNLQKTKQSLAIRAYEILHEKIITMELEPGTHLDEKELVQELGIGRTPVREALLRLTTESLVKSEPNKGFVVKPLTLQDVKAMFEALNVIETGICPLTLAQDTTECVTLMKQAHERVKRAISETNLLELVRANHDFHMHFARCSGNQYLIRALNEVRNEVNRLAYLSFGGDLTLRGDLHQHYQTVIEEQALIIIYLKKKDSEALRQIIKDHIRTFQHRVIKYLTS